MANKYEHDYILNKCKEIHGNKYDYSLFKYINRRTKIKYICKEHGIIEQTPIYHMNGGGCHKCYNYGKLNNKSFIEKSKKIHGDKYDYSLVDYKNTKKEVKIICKEHGIFEQKPNYHLSGNGCIICGGKFNKKETFINNFRKIHGDKYDYSLVEYENNKTKVEIICKEHGIFLQRPDNHLHGYGCPSCNSSKGEMEIINFLTENNIEFEIQKSFNKCKNINLLKFDFYLPEHNICIEYDGEQHYKPIDFFGGIKNFNNQILRDKIKNEFCLKNKIHLIRIKYNDNIINELKVTLINSRPISTN